MFPVSLFCQPLILICFLIPCPGSNTRQFGPEYVPRHENKSGSANPKYKSEALTYKNMTASQTISFEPTHENKSMSEGSTIGP